jgi:hypothetical protein
MYQRRPQIWCIASLRLSGLPHFGGIRLLFGYDSALDEYIHSMYPIQMIVACGITAMHRSFPVLQLRIPI